MSCATRLSFPSHHPLWSETSCLHGAEYVLLYPMSSYMQKICSINNKLWYFLDICTHPDWHVLWWQTIYIYAAPVSLTDFMYSHWQGDDWLAYVSAPYSKLPANYVHATFTWVFKVNFVLRKPALRSIHSNIKILIWNTQNLKFRSEESIITCQIWLPLKNVCDTLSYIKPSFLPKHQKFGHTLF